MNIRAYHGTKKNIERFCTDYQGKGLDQYGSGFYFTSDKELAKSYALEPRRNPSTGIIITNPNDSPTVISAAITLENPIVISGTKYSNLSAIIPTKKQIGQIIRELPSLYVDENNVLGDYFSEYWDKSYSRERLITRFVNEYYSSADLRQLDNLFADYPDVLHKAIKEYMGYDGIIVEFDESKHIIPWFSEQIEIVEKESVEIEKEEEYER